MFPSHSFTVSICASNSFKQQWQQLYSDTFTTIHVVCPSHWSSSQLKLKKRRQTQTLVRPVFQFNFSFLLIFQYIPFFLDAVEKPVCFSFNCWQMQQRQQQQLSVFVCLQSWSQLRSSTTFGRTITDKGHVSMRLGCSVQLSSAWAQTGRPRVHSNMSSCHVTRSFSQSELSWPAMGSTRREAVILARLLPLPTHALTFCLYAHIRINISFCKGLYHHIMHFCVCRSIIIDSWLNVSAGQCVPPSSLS